MREKFLVSMVRLWWASISALKARKVLHVVYYCYMMAYSVTVVVREDYLEAIVGSGWIRSLSAGWRGVLDGFSRLSIDSLGVRNGREVLKGNLTSYILWYT